MDGTRKDPPQTPGLNVTGPVPVKAEMETIPVEQMQKLEKAGQPAQTPLAPVQFVPVQVGPANTSINPGLGPNAQVSAAPAQGTTGK
jgi:hypothetical protein